MLAATVKKSHPLQELRMGMDRTNSSWPCTEFFKLLPGLAIWHMPFCFRIANFSAPDIH